MPGTIVVGVDGSPASEAALRWAAEEARLRASALVAVYAWAYIPPSPIGDPGMIAMPAGDLAGQLEAERDAADAKLRAMIARALPAEPSVRLERRLVEGDAAEALTAEAAGAALVVVGASARTGLRSALLGSVSRYVVDHVRCPVVVVKSPD